MNMYMVVFGMLAILTVGITWLIRYWAKHLKLLDDPHHAPDRKSQKMPIPLMGGLAMYSVFMFGISWLFPELTTGYLLPKYIFGISIAGLVLMIGGYLDDRYHLRPFQQIIFPVIAALIMIAVGVGIEYISNPLGGTLVLDHWQFKLFTWKGLPYQLTLLADGFTLLWLLGTMYTTKLMDGLDGLVPGITLIGGSIIFFVSVSEQVKQPETGLLALIVAATALGFLLWNFYPAKIYLGEGGSLWCGFMLGVLAILSGSKIATALLILGLPIIDIIWVMLRRGWIERRSLFSGDTLHLHYQLRLLGMSDRSIVLLYYGITGLFGLSSLIFVPFYKFIAFIILGIVSCLLLGIVFYKAQQHHETIPKNH